MFSSRPKNIIFITSKQLAIKGEGISDTEALTFMPENVKNLEVTNKETFKTSIYTFIGKTDIKRQKIVCVLGEDLLFEKRVALESLEHIKQEKEAFIKELPFDSTHIVCITLAKEKEVYFIATNKDIYSLVKEGFESMGWKIEAVVPIFVFTDLRHKESLTGKDVEKITMNKKLIEASNFLVVDNGGVPIVAEKQKEVEQQDEKTSQAHEEGAISDVTSNDHASLSGSIPAMSYPQKRKSFKKLFIFALLIIALVVGGAYCITRQKGSGSLLNILSKPTPTVVPTLIPTATPVPTPSIAKKDIVVQILNGTAITGLAGKVKSQLLPLGYTNITTGNADSQNASATTVAFSTKVPQSFQSELMDTLKKTFSSISIDTTSVAGSIDIKIIAGTP